jgi:hypothetical protein
VLARGREEQEKDRVLRVAARQALAVDRTAARLRGKADGVKAKARAVNKPAPGGERERKADRTARASECVGTASTGRG